MKTQKERGQLEVEKYLKIREELGTREEVKGLILNRRDTSSFVTEKKMEG